MMSSDWSKFGQQVEFYLLIVKTIRQNKASPGQVSIRFIGFIRLKTIYVRPVHHCLTRAVIPS